MSLYGNLPAPSCGKEEEEAKDIENVWKWQSDAKWNTMDAVDASESSVEIVKRDLDSTGSSKPLKEDSVKSKEPASAATSIRFKPAAATKKASASELAHKPFIMPKSFGEPSVAAMASPPISSSLSSPHPAAPSSTLSFFTPSKPRRPYVSEKLGFMKNEEYDPSKPNDYDSLLPQIKHYEEEERQRRLRAAMRAQQQAQAQFRGVEAQEQEPWQMDDQTPSDWLPQSNMSSSFSNNVSFTSNMASSQHFSLGESGEDAYQRRLALSQGSSGSWLPSSPSAQPSSLGAISSSRVVVFKNMADADQDMDEIVFLTLKECQTFGPVTSSYIFKNPKQTHGPEAIRLFFTFESMMDAAEAAGALNGEHFDGRPVKTELYDEKAFENRIYDL